MGTEAKKGGPPMECATAYTEGHRIGSLAAFGFAAELALVQAFDEDHPIESRILRRFGDALIAEAVRRYPNDWPEEAERRNLARFTGGASESQPGESAPGAPRQTG